MKKLVMSAFLLFAFACKVLAAGDAQESKPVKDLCLLDSNNCPGNFRYDAIEKIKRLNSAIKLGEAIYTPGEVEHLKSLRTELRESFDFDDNPIFYKDE
jgi:hypothetical protein